MLYKLIMFAIILSVFIYSGSYLFCYDLEAMLLSIEVQDSQNIVIIDSTNEKKLVSADSLVDGVKIAIIGLDFGWLRVDYGHSELLWNNDPIAPIDAKIRVMGKPKIQDFEKAEVKSILPRIQFLEKVNDETFRLRELDNSLAPGIRVIYECKEKETGHDLQITYRIELSYIASRKQIPGLLLDVGEPIIEKRELDGVTAVELNKWHLVSLHSFSSDGGSKYCLINSIKVTK